MIGPQRAGFGMDFEGTVTTLGAWKLIFALQEVFYQLILAGIFTGPCKPGALSTFLNFYLAPDSRILVTEKLCFSSSFQVLPTRD